jgi:hypothetical protein
MWPTSVAAILAASSEVSGTVRHCTSSGLREPFAYESATFFLRASPGDSIFRFFLLKGPRDQIIRSELRAVSPRTIRRGALTVGRGCILLIDDVGRRKVGEAKLPAPKG